MKLHDVLTALAHSHEKAEFNLRVRGHVRMVSDSHGLCIQLQLDMRDYKNGVIQPRTVWIDADEIVEVQP